MRVYLKAGYVVCEPTFKANGKPEIVTVEFTLADYQKAVKK